MPGSVPVLDLGVLVEPGNFLPEFWVIGQVSVPRIGGVAQESEHTVEDVGLLLLELPFLVAEVLALGAEMSSRRGPEAVVRGEALLSAPGQVISTCSGAMPVAVAWAAPG